MNSTRSTGINRRNAVRVQDRVLFSYRSVTEEEYNAVRKDFSRGISFYNTENVAEMQLFVGARNALDSLRERDRDLADFLNYLDTKMNMMLQKIGGEKSPFESLKLQKVTLSASGLSFFCAEELAIGQLLDMHLVLLPSYLHIYCYGKVVNCVEVERGEKGTVYKIAVTFVLLLDDDRERLIQHNFRQQRMALSNRRAGKNS